MIKPIDIRGAGYRVRGMFSRIRVVLHLSYFVIILLCVALVGAASFYISSGSTAEQVESASLQIVRQIEKNMDNDFQNKRNLLLAPYYNSEYIDGINAYAGMDVQARFQFRQRLGDLFLKSFNITPIRDFNRFQIYYSDGEQLASSDSRQPWTAAQARASDWFIQTVARDGRVYFSGLTGAAAPMPDDSAYTSSLLIRDFANPDSFIIVRVEYNAALFRLIGQNDNLSPNSRMLILDEKNRTVYSSGELPSAASVEALLPHMPTDSGKFWFGEGSGEMLVSYTKSEYSSWKVVLLRPKNEIFKPLDQIKTATLLTALLAFVVTFLISVLFGRSITNPILDLYKTVNRVKRGDFSIRVKVRRNDEIGRIAMNFNDMQEELQKLIETKYIYQIKLQQVELAMLYSQINPHFLYNTLDSIKAMADYYQAGEVGDMAQSLADMFRYNTKNKREVVTLREELEQIDAYMRIQGIRFEDKIRYEQQIDEALHNFPLLKMTLQPLVENAVFHGAEQSRDQTVIRLSARLDGERLLLTVSDDGVGIPAERLREIRERLSEPLYIEDIPLSASGSGIGLSNVFARYAIRLGGQFNFVIESKEGEGTSITLAITPLFA